MRVTVALIVLDACEGTSGESDAIGIVEVSAVMARCEEWNSRGVVHAERPLENGLRDPVR